MMACIPQSFDRLWEEEKVRDVLLWNVAAIGAASYLQLNQGHYAMFANTRGSVTCMGTWEMCILGKTKSARQ